MMKKMYQKPSMKAVRIKETLMAASGEESLTVDKSTVISTTGDNTAVGLSKKSSIWDDGE